MFAILAIGFLVVLDQITKRIAYAYLREIGSIQITSFFSLTYLENSGAAFGIMYGARWFFIVFTVVILFCMLIYYIKLPINKSAKWEKITIVTIAAGAIGNFIDRLLFGFVIDFLHITAINFPIFNFADILIVFGAFVLTFTTIFVKD